MRCVHKGVVKYAIKSAVIQFWGQKHTVEIAVNPRLWHSLILGTNWPAFSQFFRDLCAYVSWGEQRAGKGDSRAVGRS